MNKEERLQKLLEAQDKLVAGLASVESALAKARGLITCQSHYLHCLTTVGGNAFRTEMLLLFPDEADAKFGLQGYQIHQCLGCGRFVLCRYDGDVIGDITDEQARRWGST